MSSNGFATAIHLEPGISPRARRLLVPFHLLVAAIPWLILPPVPALACMALLLLLSWRERQERQMPRCIARHADGTWWIDETGPFTLQPTTFVTSWLVVLSLDGVSGSRRLALPADCLPARQWRHLRVILRIGTADPR